MLTSTFQHIHGIGEKTEKKIWAAGLTSWRAFLDAPQRAPLRQAQRDALCRQLEQSLHHLRRRDAQYFSQRLAPALHWRLYPEFCQRVAYLDIETTGTSPHECAITVIGVYDGHQPRAYVQGHDLACFGADIEEFSLLVTYNGQAFDLPFIRRELGLPLRQAHIDLRHPLAALGYTGGLKKIEQRLGLEREGPLALLDGWCAVLLWQYHMQGQAGALETLLRYNLEDVIHLPALLAEVYNTRIKRLPFWLPGLTFPQPPAIPFDCDPAVVRRVLRATGKDFGGQSEIG